MSLFSSVKSNAAVLLSIHAPLWSRRITSSMNGSLFVFIISCYCGYSTYNSNEPLSAPSLRRIAYLPAGCPRGAAHLGILLCRSSFLSSFASPTEGAERKRTKFLLYPSPVFLYVHAFLVIRHPLIPYTLKSCTAVPRILSLHKLLREIP